MPIYEFRCLECWARVTVFFRPPQQPEPRCTRCGSTRVVRLMGRFATMRSTADLLEGLTDVRPRADTNGSGATGRDGRATARWKRRMGRKRGGALGGVEEPENGGQAG